MTMINAIFSAISTYFLSFFPLSRWVKREIDSIRRRFLWKGAHDVGKGFSLVNWKRVCKCEEFSGLEFINLRDFNMTFLLKWWWKLLHDPDHKRISLVSHNYRPKTIWWSDRRTNGASLSPF